MNDPLDKINQEIADAVSVISSLKAEEIQKVAELIAKAVKYDHKILVCGNGGSAADAQHFAGEMINKLRETRRPYPAIALTCNTSNLTSIANDTSYAAIFSRQISALGNEGDVLVVFTTSGKSSNVVQACKKAVEKHIWIIAFIGQPSPELFINQFNPIYISVASSDTPRIQQAHEVAYHIVCQLVEDILEEKKEEEND